MRTILFWLGLLIVAPALADPRPPSVTAGGEYLTTPLTLTNGQVARLQFDVNGNLKTTGGGTGGDATEATLQDILTAIQGPVAAGGNLIGKVGIDQTTPGTTNGVSGASTAADATALTLLLKDYALGGVYNGATIDMVRGGDVNNVAAATGYLNALGVARYNATLPTLTDTRYNALQADSRGNLQVSLWSGATGPVGTGGASADAVTAATTGLATRSLGYAYNGASWDRAFTCASQAAVAVTAGNTTQIIALSASTVIRICTVSLTIATTGTFAMLSGTGSNCGTPANATGTMNLLAGTPYNVVASAGSSVFRGTAGGEFCITATTGNVNGYVTYAQY